jgi:hypothetical protein
MPVIPAIQEMGVGRSQTEAGLGKSLRLYLENRLKNGSSGRMLA